jgi:hypothetical protein
MKKIKMAVDRPAVEIIARGSVENSYDKARFEVYEDGHIVLYSYNTPVILKNPDGTFNRLWMGRSHTTSRHINMFFGLTSKDVDKLTYIDPSDLPTRAQYHFEEED